MRKKKHDDAVYPFLLFFSFSNLITLKKRKKRRLLYHLSFSLVGPILLIDEECSTPPTIISRCLNELSQQKFRCRSKPANIC
jgi:hypothetical protein